ncbi:hypothetical protein [Lacticaseibacillus jixiensis]|uniref:hypothetical protein n=1 Tax=Lacticaseibacillus jixiensis TaxID=3231926 RepID=UPI0036F33C7B
MQESYALTLTVPQRELLLIQAQILDAPVPPDLRDTLTPQSVVEAPKRLFVSEDDLVYYAELFIEAIRRYPPALLVAIEALRQIQLFGVHHQTIHSRLHTLPPIPVLTQTPETMSVALSYTQRRELTRFLSQSVLAAAQGYNQYRLTRLLPRVTTLARLLPNRFSLFAQPLALTSLEALALGLMVLALRNTAVATVLPFGGNAWQRVFTQLLDQSKQVDAHVYTLLKDVANEP